MSLLKPLGQGPKYLKAGFLGFQGSGKTLTAILLAIATRQASGLKGPIAFYDTESGTDYVTGAVKKLTGTDLLGVKSRDFEDLISLGRECVDHGVSVLIADSMTHVWRNLCDSYLAGINEARRKYAESKNWQPKIKSALEFQDWAPIKKQWERWTTFYLNAPLHIIICGRAGYEYDMEKNEDTGKKELVKTGTKMKTESEFGFEPSLLVEMEKGEGENRETARVATVIKDRFRLLDGKQGFFRSHATDESADLKAVSEFFAPHIHALNAGAHVPIKTAVAPMDVNEEGDPEWQREKKSRTIRCEEIQGLLTSHYPGQTAEEKKKKADLIFEFFHTRSWTAVESMNSDQLGNGLRALREKLEPQSPPAAVEPVPPQASQTAAAADVLPVSAPRADAEAGAPKSTTAVGQPVSSGNPPSQAAAGNSAGDAPRKDAHPWFGEDGRLSPAGVAEVARKLNSRGEDVGLEAVQFLKAKKQMSGDDLHSIKREALDTILFRVVDFWKKFDLWKSGKGGAK